MKKESIGACGTCGHTTHTTENHHAYFKPVHPPLTPGLAPFLIRFLGGGSGDYRDAKEN